MFQYELAKQQELQGTRTCSLTRVITLRYKLQELVDINAINH